MPRPARSRASASPSFRSAAPALALIAAGLLGGPAGAQEQRVSVFTADPNGVGQTIEGFGTAAAVFMDGRGEGGEGDWYDYGRFADVLVNDFNAEFLRVELSHQAFALQLPDTTSRLDLDYSTERTLEVGVAGSEGLEDVLQRNVNLFNFEALRARVSGRAAEAVTAAATAGGRDVNLIASIWTPPHYLKGTGFNANGVDEGEPFLSGSNSVDSAGGTLIDNDETYAQFGEYVAAYVTGFEKAWGVDLDALSIQNEPDLRASFNSQLLENPERYKKALVAVDDAFNKYGIDTRLIGPELVGVGSQVRTPFDNGTRAIVDDDSFLKAVEIWETLEEDEATKDILDVFATHGVDGRELIINGEITLQDTDLDVDFAARWNQLRDGFTNQELLNNEPDPTNDQFNFAGVGREATVWQTETSGDLHLWVPTLDDVEEDRALRFDQPGYGSGALGQAVAMHHALAEGDVSAYLFWQLTYDTGQDDEVPSRLDENFVLLKVGDDQVYDTDQVKYAAAKHFSRFARAGMTRFDLTLTEDVARPSQLDGPFIGELLGSLYVDESTGDVSLVLINTLKTEQVIDIDLSTLFGESLLGIEEFAGVVTDAEHTFALLDPVALSDTGLLRLTLGAESLVSLTNNATFIPEPASGFAAAAAGLLLLRQRRPTFRG